MRRARRALQVAEGHQPSAGAKVGARRAPYLLVTKYFEDDIAVNLYRKIAEAEDKTNTGQFVFSCR